MEAKKFGKVACLDSGLGGLIFILDAFFAISEKIKSSNKYIDILHIGDQLNMPYGIKSIDQLTLIVENLIEKTISLGYYNLIFGCNTACTVLNDKMIQKYKKLGVNLMSILDISALALYNSGLKFANNLNKKEINVLILGTKRTVESQQYKTIIEDIHLKKESKLKLNVFQYSPLEWEKGAENLISDLEKEELVREDLTNLKKIHGNDFKKITSIGLFCTHYPYFETQINNFFMIDKMNVELVKQGLLFKDFLHENLVENKNLSKDFYKFTSLTTDPSFLNSNKNFIQILKKDININFDSV